MSKKKVRKQPKGFKPVFPDNPEQSASSGGAEHTKGARGSTQEKHEESQTKKKQSRGGESGDTRRRAPRRKPLGWKGPWPP